MSAHTLSHNGETKVNSINRAALIASASIFGLVAICGLSGLWTQNKLDSALDESDRAANLIRAHMSADMMHDAIRADAQLVCIDRRGDRLAVHALDVALRIKEIRLRRTTGHEEEDHTLRLRGQTRCPQRERTRRRLHEVVQRERTEATGGVLKPCAARMGL